MRLYFVRHGESEANLLRVFSNRRSTHRLTDKGRQQALTLARYLQGASVTKLFCSPLPRAVETAEILASELILPYEIADPLREYDCGVLEGKSDGPSWELYYAILDDWIQHGRWERRFEQGESFLDVRDRFVPFIDQLISTFEDASDTIVLVGHNGIYRCMLPLVLKGIDFDFVMAHSLSSMGYVLAEKRAEGLACVEWRESIS
jgi:broad specificity phosphatase PhoE